MRAQNPGEKLPWLKDSDYVLEWVMTDSPFTPNMPKTLLELGATIGEMEDKAFSGAFVLRALQDSLFFGSLVLEKGDTYSLAICDGVVDGKAKCVEVDQDADVYIGMYLRRIGQL